MFIIGPVLPSCTWFVTKTWPPPCLCLASVKRYAVLDSLYGSSIVYLLRSLSVFGWDVHFRVKINPPLLWFHARTHYLRPKCHNAETFPRTLHTHTHTDVLQVFCSVTTVRRVNRLSRASVRNCKTRCVCVPPPRLVWYLSIWRIVVVFCLLNLSGFLVVVCDDGGGGRFARRRSVSADRLCICVCLSVFMPTAINTATSTDCFCLILHRLKLSGPFEPWWWWWTRGLVASTPPTICVRSGDVSGDTYLCWWCRRA